jgi:hypothetical protein
VWFAGGAKRSDTHDFEALAFVADERGGVDAVVVEEDFVRVNGAAAHLLDALELEAWLRRVEVDEEERKALGGLLHFFKRSCAREENHSGGDLGGGDPAAELVRARESARQR